MMIACIRERKWQGTILYAIVIALRYSGTKSPGSFSGDTMIILGDETKVIRQLQAAMNKFQERAPVAGITRELKMFCDKYGIAISPKWRIAGDV